MTTQGSPGEISTILGRSVGFLLLWIVLIGAAPGDLPLGVIAAGCATWASMELWPASGAISLSGLLRFAVRFVPQAVVAGVEVARFAFAPRITLQPGVVGYRPALSAGPARRALCAVMSLQPGKLPIATQADGTLLIHCLEPRGAVQAEVADDEAAFCSVLRDGGSRD
jgi:multicomponent Na+:H+ antiporter subunit E